MILPLLAVLPQPQDGRAQCPSGSTYPGWDTLHIHPGIFFEICGNQVITSRDNIIRMYDWETGILKDSLVFPYPQVVVSARNSQLFLHPFYTGDKVPGNYEGLYCYDDLSRPPRWRVKDKSCRYFVSAVSDNLVFTSYTKFTKLSRKRESGYPYVKHYGTRVFRLSDGKSVFRSKGPWPCSWSNVSEGKIACLPYHSRNDTGAFITMYDANTMKVISVCPSKLNEQNKAWLHQSCLITSGRNYGFAFDFSQEKVLWKQSFGDGYRYHIEDLLPALELLTVSDEDEFFAISNRSGECGILNLKAGDLYNLPLKRKPYSARMCGDILYYLADNDSIDSIKTHSRSVELRCFHRSSEEDHLMWTGFRYGWWQIPYIHSLSASGTVILERRDYLRLNDYDVPFLIKVEATKH